MDNIATVLLDNGYYASCHDIIISGNDGQYKIYLQCSISELCYDPESNTEYYKIIKSEYRQFKGSKDKVLDFLDLNFLDTVSVITEFLQSIYNGSI